MFHSGARRCPNLRSAAVVCRNVETIIGLEHAEELISSYLDCSVCWTLDSAVSRGLPYLFHRLSLHESSVRYVEAKCDRFHAALAAKCDRVHAVVDGPLENMVTLNRLFPDLVISEAAVVAAEAGHTHVLEWLYSRRGNVCWRPDILKNAARSGVLSAVRFLMERFPPAAADVLVDILEITTQRGSHRISRYIWRQLLVLEPTHADLSDIVSRAHLELAKWMIRSAAVPSLIISIDIACLRGDLEFVRWAQQHQSIATVEAMNLAATFGHLELLKWLHQNRTEGCTTHAMDSAAAYGYFEIVQWLHENRVEGCTDQAFFMAATRGHLDIAQWLFSHRAEGFPLNTFDHVCANGHIDTAQWLHENNLGGGSVNAMDWAAAQNHLHVVQWLHHARLEGCTVLAMNAAACHGHLEVVLWLAENRTEGCTTDAIDHAAGNGHFNVVRWLAENRMEWCSTSAMDNAARGGHHNILRWFNTHPASLGCTTDAMDGAVSEGHFGIVVWLHHNRVEGCTVRGPDAAAGAGHMDMLEFFRENRPEQLTVAGFRACVIRGDLHTARWIAEYYNTAFDMQVVLDRAFFNGWTDTIIFAAFSAHS